MIVIDKIQSSFRFSWYIILRRNHFEILRQYVVEQIMTSKENMAWNYINIKGSEKVTEVKIYGTW